MQIINLYKVGAGMTKQGLAAMWWSYEKRANKNFFFLKKGIVRGKIRMNHRRK